MRAAAGLTWGRAGPSVRRMIFRPVCAFLVVALFACPLAAVTVEGLYGATVKIVDRSPAASARGVDEALAQVIVKLTGDSASAADPRFASLRRQAQKFVTVVGQAEGGSAADGYRLRVEFDARALAAALRERGAELWPKERPALQAWVAMEDEDGRRFAPATEDDRPVFDVLARRASERGLPIERPALPADLTRGKREAVLETLVPEHGDATTPQVAVLLARQGDGWTAQWRSSLGGEVDAWETRGADAVALLEAGTDRVADRLGAQQRQAGAAGGGSQSFVLTLQGLMGSADYGFAMQRLRHLDVVESVQVEAATGDELRLAVTAHGGLAAVEQGLKLDPAFGALPGERGKWRLVSSQGGMRHE